MNDINTMNNHDGIYTGKKTTFFKFLNIHSRSFVILMCAAIFIVPCLTAQIQAQPGGEGDKKTEKTIN